MARKFDLAELMGGVSKMDTVQQIEEIPLHKIAANEANFYRVEDVTDLRESIQLVGLQQPLVVTETAGGYRLIAGHRRYKALSELERKTAPCIVLRDLTETVEELTLILTNSTAREMSYYERIQQARRLKELFIKRREEGAELPGRIRDMVAQAMQESASQIARMEAINKHLSKGWKKELKSKHISASTAYELSKLPPVAQDKLLQETKSPSAEQIKAAEEIANHYDWAPLACPKVPSRPCTRYKARAPKVLAGVCPSCCDGCVQADTCSLVCGHVKREKTNQAKMRRWRDEQKAEDEAYQASAFRQAKLRVLDRIHTEPALDAPMSEELHRDLVQLRSLSRENADKRTTAFPSLQALFELSEILGEPLGELLGLAGMPAAVWHRYPQDTPPERATVIAQSRAGRLSKLTYLHGQFGEMLGDTFVDMPYEIKFWTDILPEE